MELFFGAVLKPLGTTGIMILVFHPVPLTILVALLLLGLLVCTGLWRRHKRIILLGAGALYAVDAAIALPRIVYAWRSPDHAVIHQKAELPARLVLVNAACDKECHARLLSGEIEEVILVRTDQPGSGNARPPRRYRAGWSRPGACPQERQQAIGYDVGARGLLRDGFCPLIEPTEIPAEGIFVVQESFLVRASEKAVPFTSTYLVDGPPGKTIELRAIEVQRRTRDGVEVLAARRKYAAPGLLGLPPLVGCWDRPDNILWVMPPGDTGCGLWRWFTWGGDWDGYQPVSYLAWAYANVFTTAARPAIPPPRPDLPPAEPAEAIEILSLASPVEDYLPKLKEALVAPSVSDATLAELVTQRARRGTLEGALVAVLARERPVAAAAIPARLGAPPGTINQPDLILTEMERDRALFDAWGDFMFDAIASSWWPDVGARARDEGDPRVERFLASLRDRDPDFLCRHLDRLPPDGGAIDYTKNRYPVERSSFLPVVIRAAQSQCGERATGFLRNLMAAPAAKRREQVVGFISRLPNNVTTSLADRAFANLLDHRGMDNWDYEGLDQRRRYVDAHLQFLLRAGQSCGDVVRRFDAAVAELRERGGTPSPYLLERLAYLNGKEPGGSLKCELR